MAKKFKVGCRYQVKPECYENFAFIGSFWDDKPKDHVFLTHEVVDGGAWSEDEYCIAGNIERKYCKRIK